MRLNRVILFFATLLLGLSLSSCEKDYEAPNDLRDFGWVTSEDKFNTDPIMIVGSQYISLMDVSQGSSQRTWTIDYNRGARFLRNEIISDQDKDYSDNIDTGLTNESDASTVHILFTENGKHTVNLRNVYDRPISFTYSYRDGANRGYKTIDTKYIDGEYVMSFDFQIEIFNSVIEPLTKVYLIDAQGNVIEEVETGVDPEDEYSFLDCELTYGQSLRFEDVTEDGTNVWTWSCEEANFPESSSVKTIDIPFYKLSEGVPFNVIHSVSRVEDSSYPSLPLSGPKEAKVQLDIFVNVSQDALDYSLLQSDNESTISFRLNNTMFDFSQAFNYDYATGDYTMKDPSKFSIEVSNGGTTVGTYTPTLAVVNESVDNLMTLTFADALYNTDDITLNYTGGESDLLIKTYEGHGALPTMASAEVVTNLIQTNGENSIIDTEMFDFTNLDESTLAGRTPQEFGWNWRNSSNNVTTENSMEFVDDPNGGGTKVLKLTVPSAVSGAFGLVNDALFTFPAGNYFLEFEMCDGVTTAAYSMTAYISNSTTIDNFESTIDTSLINNAAKGGFFRPTTTTWSVYSRNATAGSPDIPYSAGGVDRRVVLHMNTYKGTFYIKRISFHNAYERP